jgi:hypothetical protein
MKPISTYVNEDGVTVQCFPEKRVKRNPYNAWGGSLALLGSISARGIPQEGAMFTQIKRKRIK